MKSQNLLPWLVWLTQVQGSAVQTSGSSHDRPLAHRAPRKFRVCKARPKTLRITTTSTADPASSQSGIQTTTSSSVSAYLDYLSTILADSATTGIILANETLSVSTSVAPTGTIQILPSLDSDVEPHTSGIVLTSLNVSGAVTSPPLLTSSIPSPTSLLQPSVLTFANTTSATPTPTATAEDGMSELEMAVNIFDQPIGTAAPPSAIKQRSDHPVPRKNIAAKAPLQTNKFYANLFLDNQLGPAFTFPYSVAWAGGQGVSGSWGISISHIEAKQRVFGEKKYNSASSYYINPIGIQSMIISAKELGKDTVLGMDSLTDFSARALLSKDNKSQPAVTFPLVQGMPYVTAQFNGATPLIQTGVYFKTMTRVTKDPKSNVAKYNFNLEDGTTWRVYAYKTKGDQLDLQVVNNGLAQSKHPFYGIVQVVKDPLTTGSEAILDDGAGIYPVTTTLSGTASGTTGTYTFQFSRAGTQTGNLYMYALPHHVASFDSTTKSLIKSVQLQTTTKGVATLVQGTQWTMVESSMPVDMNFAPWSPTKNSVTSLSSSAKSTIKAAAQKEVSQNMISQTNLDSMYFSGKALAKFGSILYVINDMLGEKALAQTGLKQLKTAFATFAANKQKYPLVYESAWGGVVSSATYVTGDSGVDFGNTYYNDHHFHYGYHILAAAYIAYLDPSWLTANKAYVNTLARDIANPSTKDKYFPTWRSFDWYHGHSWAHGLFLSYDGKNQESSSEDMMHAYALKMWGTATKDTNLVARANLQLAVLSRSLSAYYLYESDNKVQPAQFIGNKVAGILFENKVDHTTFFSPDIEAIQGIHMIPILPPSSFIRKAAFVKEEWDVFFSDGRIDSINNAWKGIIYANYATIEPKKAWSFFSSASFDTAWIDGGASLTWYLAYAAALAGV